MHSIVKYCGIVLLTVLTINPAFGGRIQDFLTKKPPEYRIQFFLGGIRAHSLDCDAIKQHQFTGERYNYDWFSISCDSGQEYQLRIHHWIRRKIKFVSCEDHANIPLACWKSWSN